MVVAIAETGRLDEILASGLLLKPEVRPPNLCAAQRIQRASWRTSNPIRTAIKATPICQREIMCEGGP